MADFPGKEQALLYLPGGQQGGDHAQTINPTRTTQGYIHGIAALGQSQTLLQDTGRGRQDVIRRLGDKEQALDLRFIPT